MSDTVITLIGNLTTDPELRFTPNGTAVSNFRIASTPRRFNSQTNQWEDGEPLFLACNVWKQPGEHAAQTLKKGMRVIVTGKLKQRSYEARDGSKRSVYEVDVEDLGPSLKYATATVERAERSTGSKQTGSTSQGWDTPTQDGFGNDTAEPPF